MGTIGQTLFRFTGAVLLGASATSIDNPGLLFAPTSRWHAAVEGTGAELQVKITPGKRAYGIRVNDFASLAGMILPNSRVDIVLVTADREQQKRAVKVVMENMRVLAIGAAPERTQDGRPISAAVASIEVTPQEAERLGIAAAQGALQLVLRGYGDPDSIASGQQPCAPQPTGSAHVRDLLLRQCQRLTVRFEQVPPPARVVPRR